MNAKQLMKECPLAKNRLKKWFLDKLEANAKNFEQDDAFKQYMIETGITDDQIETVFKEGGRAALDLLDEYELYISVVYSKKGFKIWINEKEFGGFHSDRKSAEEVVLIKAVKLLEEKLTEQLTKAEDTDESKED